MYRTVTLFFMKNDKTTLKEISKLFNISRTTLYTYLKKLEITPEKIKNRSYLTYNNEQRIKLYIDNKKNLNTKTEHSKQLENLKVKNKTLEIKNIGLKTRLEVLEEQNNKIIFQIGRATEKIILLETEKLRKIEIESESSKQGVFRKSWNFITNKL